MHRQSRRRHTNQLTEKCAVFGAYGKDLEASRLAFYGLWALQHRGQESSGIASTDGKQLHDHNGIGLVDGVYHERNLKALKGHIAIGHNRYSTSGGRDKSYNQPFVDKARRFAFAHNGNLPDYHKLEEFLVGRGVLTDKMNDSAMMAAAISCYLDDGLDLVDATKKAYPLFEGVFSVVAMDKDRLVALRDRCGIRPLSIGKLGRGFVIASETCAFETIGAKFVRDVRPGEMVVIDNKGLSSHQIVKGSQKLDIFELVYFARPDSIMLGKRVNDVRKRFGHEIANEFPINADIVVAVPDTGIPAALGYSQSTGIPFEMGLIKNRYIHRTFIRPTTQLRERDLKIKLTPVPDTLRGQRVILVDDSIVRGTTTRQVVSMVFEAGAKEVHLTITSPPVRYPDFYGINTPTQTELLATRMNNEQMREYVGATSLRFLSYKGMIRATGLPASKFSTSCFNGVYPISIGVRAKELQKLDKFSDASSSKRSLKKFGAPGVISTPKIAILASGEGTTAEAFIRANSNGKILSQVGLIISNRKNAGIFDRIARLNKKFGLNIGSLLINSEDYPAQPGEDVRPGDQTISEQMAIIEAIKRNKIDLIVSMGYLKRIGPLLIERFGWNQHRSNIYEVSMINTHPGLLPETRGLYGIHVQHHVLDKKLPHGGQTLHAVAENYDEGPIIAEHRVPVKLGDKPDILFSRVQAVEKKNLPLDIDNFIMVRRSYLRGRSRSA